MHPGVFPGVDVNQDGFPDVVIDDARTADDQDRVHVVFSGAADRSFATTFEINRIQVNYRSTSVRGDIDGNGSIDQIVLEPSDADAVLTVQHDVEVPNRESTDVSYAIRKPHDTAGMQSLHIADVTGDGTLDVLYSYGYAAPIIVLAGEAAFEAGDVNRDGTVNTTDLDLLAPFGAASADPTTSTLRLDMTGDLDIDEHDVTHWVEVIANTRRGDVNLDGNVDFADFLQLSANFGSTEATWSSGDFNGDANVDFDDFLVLSANFGYKSTDQ